MHDESLNVQYTMGTWEMYKCSWFVVLTILSHVWLNHWWTCNECDGEFKQATWIMHTCRNDTISGFNENEM